MEKAATMAATKDVQTAVWRVVTSAAMRVARLVGPKDVQKVV